MDKPRPGVPEASNVGNPTELRMPPPEKSSPTMAGTAPIGGAPEAKQTAVPPLVSETPSTAATLPDEEVNLADAIATDKPAEPSPTDIEAVKQIVAKEPSGAIKEFADTTEQLSQLGSNEGS